MKNILIFIIVLFAFSLNAQVNLEKANSVLINTTEKDGVVTTKYTYLFDGGEKWVHIQKDNDEEGTLKVQKARINDIRNEVQVLNRHIDQLNEALEKKRWSKSILLEELDKIKAIIKER